MKASGSPRRAFAAALLAGWLAAPAHGEDQQPATVRLDRATLRAQLGDERIGPVAIGLPLHWDIEWPGRSGTAELALEFDEPAAAANQREPYALFIPRLGNAYEIELNDVLLASAGSLRVHGDRWSAKHPVSLSFPARLLRAHNVVQVRIRADAGYRAGLSVVHVGPAGIVLPIARRSEWLRVVLPEAISVLSLLVAGFCLLLWWQQREPLYAWAALGEALWAVSVADTVLEFSPLPWPYWGLALLLLRAAWSWALYSIAEVVYGRRPTLERRVMAAVQASTPLVILAMVAVGTTEPLKVWYAATFAVWSWVIASLAWSLRSGVGSERAMILIAIAGVYAASLRDSIAGRWDASLYDESAWAKYVAVLVAISLMWIVSRRFLHARAEASRLNASLAQRIDEKERELRGSFTRLGEVERERAVLAERERILRDMHDGVGAHLATAVRQLEGGRAPVGEVLRTLRESMDHLKLSIDAMGLPRGDVNALLASLRYRLQPRIESAGLRLEWDVDALPVWEQATDDAMRHLQYLVLEAISNALQHAQATVLRVRAAHGNAGTCIVLEDDGRGVGAGGPRVPRSLEARARSAGAEVEVGDAHPGTRVLVTLSGPRMPDGVD
jgi:signal transduction histidine kinase